VHGAAGGTPGNCRGGGAPRRPPGGAWTGGRRRGLPRVPPFRGRGEAHANPVPSQASSGPRPAAWSAPWVLTPTPCSRVGQGFGDAQEFAPLPDRVGRPPDLPGHLLVGQSAQQGQFLRGPPAAVVPALPALLQFLPPSRPPP